jgi:endonuclease-3 related protein
MADIRKHHDGVHLDHSSVTTPAADKTINNIQALYENLANHFGPRCDPDTWWPICANRTAPPEFERVITNVLVQNSSWRTVPATVQRLDEQNLLTASTLANAPVERIADCIKPTGLQSQKALRLKTLCDLVVTRFGTESSFCQTATRQDLLSLTGIGPETADRILLYACSRLAWPGDTYCLRVFAHHGLLPDFPSTPAERTRSALEVKAMVADGLAPRVPTWQRFHALMQLEGERIRQSSHHG